MSVSHSSLGALARNLRSTRSSSVAALAGFHERFLGPGKPLMPSSRMMDKISFLLTMIPCSISKAARMRNMP